MFEASLGRPGPYGEKLVLWKLYVFPVPRERAAAVRRHLATDGLGRVRAWLEEERPENARRLRGFMRGARLVSYWAFGAMILSIPGSSGMDFDPSMSPPWWAATSFFIGLLGFVVLFLLIPARILGRVALFVLGDGTSRIDTWLRLGFVVLVLAIVEGTGPQFDRPELWDAVLRYRSG